MACDCPEKEKVVSVLCTSTLTSDETAVKAPALASVTCFFCNYKREVVPRLASDVSPHYYSTVLASSYSWAAEFSMKSES